MPWAGDEPSSQALEGALHIPRRAANLWDVCEMCRDLNGMISVLGQHLL